jgi:hypothetical protein
MDPQHSHSHNLPPADLLWLMAMMGVAIFAIVAVRAVLGRRRGDSVTLPPLPDARFCETWLSGSAGFFAAARNCLWVSVTADALLIGLHFPFSLFIPRWLGLEARIAPADILALESKRTFLQGTQLTIRFRNAGGRPQSIALNLRQEDAFVSSVKELCRAHGKALP